MAVRTRKHWLGCYIAWTLVELRNAQRSVNKELGTTPYGTGAYLELTERLEAINSLLVSG
jgi:hypothetical protein